MKARSGDALVNFNLIFLQLVCVVRGSTIPFFLIVCSHEKPCEISVCAVL